MTIFLRISSLRRSDSQSWTKESLFVLAMIYLCWFLLYFFAMLQIARVQVLASEKTVLAAPLAVVFITTDAQASHESEMLARILSTRTNSAIVYRASTDTVKDSLNGERISYWVLW